MDIKDQHEIFDFYSKFSDDILIEISEKLIIKRISENISAISDYTAKTFIGKTIVELLYDKENEKLESVCHILKSDFIEINLKFNFKHNNNCRCNDREVKVIKTEAGFLLLVKYLPRRNSDKCYELDNTITETQESIDYSTETLQKCKTIYKTIVNSANDGIIYQDKDGTIRIWNNTCENIFGISADEVIGKKSFEINWQTYNQKGDLIASNQHPSIISLKTGKPSQDTLMKIVRNDGTHSWIKVNTSPIFHESRTEADSVIIAFSDVTALYEALDEISISSSLFNSFYENMPSGSSIYEVINDGKTGKDFIIKRFNEKALEIENKSLEQVVGKSLYDLRPNIDTYGLIKVMRKVWKSGKAEYLPSRKYQDNNYENYYENYIFRLPDGKVATIYNDVTDRVMTEEELRAKTEKLELAISSNTDGVWDIKFGSENAYWNHACYTMLGYEPNEFTISKAKWIELIHPDDFEPHQLETRRQTELTTRFSVEFRLKCKNGDYKWILGRGQVHFIEGKNTPHRLTGTHTDISERKKHEEDIRKSEEKYRSLFESMQEGFALHKIICDDKGNAIDYVFIDVNPEFERITGLKKEVILHKTVREVLPKTEKYWIKKYGEVALKGEPIEFENYSIELNKFFKVRAYSPMPNYFATLFADVTEKTHHLNELLKLSLAVDQNPASIVITNTDGKIEYVNQKFCELTGYSFDEAYNQNPNIISSGETSAETYYELWNTIKSGKTWKGELKNKTKNGIFFWEKMTISPVLDKNSNIINYLAIKEDITEKRKLSKIVIQQDMTYKSLLDNLPNMLFIHRQGEIVYANKQSIEASKLKYEDILGKNILEFVHTDYRSLVIDKINRRAKGEIVGNYELKVVAGNDVKDVFIFSHDTYFEQKKSSLVIMLDITERKKQELKLIESEQKFRALAESAQFAILIYRDNHWIYSNPAGEALTGYTQAELQKSNIWDIVHDDYKDIIKYRAQKRLSGEDVLKTYEIKIITKNKEVRWIYLTADIIVFNGEKSGLLSCMDITKLKEYENSLKLSEEKYRLLAENSSDVAFTLSKDYRFTYLSPPSSTIDGFNREEMLGKSIWEIMKPEGIEYIKEVNAKRLQNEANGIKTDTLLHELELKQDDGTWLWTEISVTPIRDSDGTLEGYHGIIRDISERKAAQDALKRSDQLKTEFLNNISHEIRTPLNGILGFAGLIVNQNVSEVVKEKYYDMIKSSSDRLLRTINDYVDISLIVSKNINIIKRKFRLLEIFDTIFTKYFTETTKAHISLNQIYEDKYKNAIVLQDKEILIKILDHLVNNAIKFTNQGKIEYGFDIVTDKIVIFVKDTGFGIDSKLGERVFDIFTKTDYQKDALNQGSGLGLSIVKGLLDTIEGSISIKGGKNQGTEINVEIPCEIFFEQLEKKSFNEIIESKSTKKRILIAEDDDTNYLYLENILRTNSFTDNIRAYDGNEAVEICKNDPSIGLVLMDIKMPVMDGIQATRLIKSKFPKMPIVATTAYAMKDEKENILREKFDSYISKPYNKSDLLKIVRSFLDE